MNIEQISIKDLKQLLRNKKVAIYGAGALGKYLVEFLKKSDLNVEVVFDKKFRKKEKFLGITATNLDNWNIEDDLKNFLVIITVTGKFNQKEIYLNLRKKGFKEIYVVSKEFLKPIPKTSRSLKNLEKTKKLIKQEGGHFLKLIAFYLPQFHPIPENDKFWGKGFTEWYNVVRGKPRFKGHYQPRLPGELGFYDLRVPEVQEQQVALAKEYGIYGFCFHFYWFKGKRLLERPILQFIQNKNINFPFCIHWANESWTRRWDGLEHEILIKQEHTLEDDIEFIKYIAITYFEHPNYIRIKGKPLVIIYRPDLFPNIKETTERWREWCYKNGIGEIFLCNMHSFDWTDPREIGFDASIEYPPNAILFNDITDEIEVIDSSFQGRVLDYESAIDQAYLYKKPEYKKFRGVFPDWDNEARRKGKGRCFINSSPENFKLYLSIVCNFTIQNFEKEERLVFINAWNEWAEGCYLEPDAKYGRAYLQAVKDTLEFFNKLNI